MPKQGAMCRRGLISSLLVAGFTGCGVVFYLLDLIFQAVGPSRCLLQPLGSSSPACPATWSLYSQLGGVAAW